MRSWSQLETDFWGLRISSGFDFRLDHQDGAAGERWHVAGAGSPQTELRFKTLARTAGEKLLEVPAAAGWPGVAEERDPVIRWYRSLRRLSGAYCSDIYAIQKDIEGNDAGAITLATIQRVYETSATLCATLESLTLAPRRRAELLCTVPRYAGPCQHWREAHSILASEEPDFAAAAHKAVSAVEGLCRIILSDSSITLGEAVKRLRSQGLLHPVFAKCIEGLWGFASSEPGVRHGAASIPAVKSRDALFVVEACEAVVVLLLALDAE